MFTGIVECTGIVDEIIQDKTNWVYTISSPISHELKIDQSVSHDGVCLTVVNINGQQHTVVAIAETLARTNLAQWQKGSVVNIERCLKADGRFDGHIVQGHVDCTAVCIKKEDLNGSWKFWFEYPAGEKNITVEKGSVTVNGTSLTVVDSVENTFSVCIIPYTYEFTGFGKLQAGHKVNIEFDIVGKYVARLLGR